MLICIERSRMRWLRYLVRIYPEFFLGVLGALLQREAQETNRTNWSNHFSQLALESFRIHLSWTKWSGRIKSVLLCLGYCNLQPDFM